MKQRKPSEAMKQWYKDLESILKSKPDATIKDFESFWGIGKSAATSRLSSMKKRGLKVPKLKRAKKVRIAIDPYCQTISFVDSFDLGDVGLPACPECRKHGRVGRGVKKKEQIKGEPTQYELLEVHFVYSEGAMYCPACAYSPEPEGKFDD